MLLLLLSRAKYKHEKKCPTHRTVAEVRRNRDVALKSHQL